jgi:hypothetical protein|tara:strand:+ start:3461 stop:4102 length:642 start_codon:yes stop_codon:yes gene_type:complete
MSLNLINGVFYSEHKLDNINNLALIEQVTNTYLNGDNDIEGDRPNPNKVDIQHTFYEDCPISGDFKNQFNIEIKKITDSSFGDNSFKLDEIWGHFTKPLEQTMVHDHAGGFEEDLQLSWVYYPHQPINAGNIHFIGNANLSRISYEVDCKPGHLYLFSPSIMHYVPRNASGVNRISISGNLKSNKHFTEEIREDNEFNSNFWYFAGRNENLLN